MDYNKFLNFSSDSKQSKQNLSYRRFDVYLTSNTTQAQKQAELKITPPLPQQQIEYQQSKSFEVIESNPTEEGFKVVIADLPNNQPSNQTGSAEGNPLGGQIAIPVEVLSKCYDEFEDRKYNCFKVWQNKKDSEELARTCQEQFKNMNMTMYMRQLYELDCKIKKKVDYINEFDICDQNEIEIVKKCVFNNLVTIKQLQEEQHKKSYKYNLDQKLKEKFFYEKASKSKIVDKYQK